MGLFLQNCPSTIELQSRNPVSVAFVQVVNELDSHVVRVCSVMYGVRRMRSSGICLRETER